MPFQVDYSSDGKPVYFVRDTPAGSTLDILKLQCLDVAGRPVPPGTAGRAWIAARDSAAVQHTWSELPDCVFDDSGCALPPLNVRSHESPSGSKPHCCEATASHSAGDWVHM